MTSPPYADTEIMQAAGSMGDAYRSGKHARDTFQGDATARRYGKTPGQIGALPDREPVAITSPPYEDSINDRNGIDPEKIRSRFGRNSQALLKGYETDPTPTPLAPAPNRRFRFLGSDGLPVAGTIAAVEGERLTLRVEQVNGRAVRSFEELCPAGEWPETLEVLP